MQTEKTLHGRRRFRSSSSMSEEGSDDCRTRKRFRASAAKFQINDRVEVRSVEEGFQGSWHPCTVIHSEKGKRHVRYENVLDNSGLNHLVEVVIVSKSLDGYVSSSDCYRREIIRLIPPWVAFEKRDLKFGLCVDVYHEEAWWEGVIFDHCDGMEERSVFFPDLGDEMRVGLDQLRITQDWDEVTEKWEQRGKWVFLELIEECERESYVAVSAKQVWYDVRDRTDFGMIGEWTFNVKDMLRHMVMEVVSGYWTLTVNEIYSVLDLPGGSLNVTQHMEKEHSELKESVLPVEKDLPVFRKETSCCGAGEVVSGALCSAKRRKNGSFWKPLKLSEIEFCPRAVKQYVLAKSKEDKKIWREKVIKHLAYLGCEIEWEEIKSGAKRYRYKLPDILGQKVYLSLIELCKVMQNDSNMNSMVPQNDKSIVHPTVDCHHLENVLHNPSEKSHDLDCCPPPAESPSVGAVDKLEYSLNENYSELKESVLLTTGKDLPMFPKETSSCDAGEVVSGAICSAKRRTYGSYWKPLKFSKTEFCPDAVKQYVLATRKEDKEFWIEKVRKHLAYLGWEIEWAKKKSGAKSYKYKLPDKLGQNVYYSLFELCKVMLNDSNMNSMLPLNDLSDCLLSNVLPNSSEKIEDPDSCPQIELPPSVVVFDDPGCCPQASQPQNDQTIVLPTVDCDLSNGLLNPSEKAQDLDSCPQFEPTLSVVVVDEPGYCPQASQPQHDQRIVHQCYRVNVLHNPSEKSHDLDSCPPPAKRPSVAVVDKPEYCPEAVVVYYSHVFKQDRRADKRKWINKAKNHLLAEGWTFDYPPPDNRKRGIIYMSPQNRQFRTLHAACKFCIEVSNLSKEPELHTIDGVAVNRSIANRKPRCLRNSKTSLLKSQGNELSLRVTRLNKRVQKVTSPCLSHQKPLNVLSWLIDSNMVLPRSKVYYHGKDGCRYMAEGRITRDGIKCSCCLKIYSTAGFENHASDSSTCRPAACIFLEDGRSLLDCQIQLMHDDKARETTEKPFSDLFQGENDYICSICHYGGELILCDQCPSSFHKTCLGLTFIPDGEWFCPSCQCRICGQRKIDGDEDETFLTCTQCEHKYHVRCLKNRDVDKSRYRENWFCGEDCEKIYAGLNELLGVPVSVGADNLTWTLMKFTDSESCDIGSTKGEFLAESFSKLNVALSLMHECFEPMKEPSCSGDIMDNVIFSRSSKLHRLNFQGFYIVLLERNEEMISVATIRVYGDKVAEVPLVGTRLQYRRHGMCRILMNELEKKLMQLGVERLVLPAVPSVLGTWTGSFGFVEMTNSERLQFVDYTFLDFQDTVMCQKQLMKIPSSQSVLSTEFQQKHDDFSGSCSVNFDNSSQASEVNQAGETDKRGMKDQQMEGINAGNNEDDHHHGSGAVDPDTVVKQMCSVDQQLQNGTSSQCSLKRQADRYANGSYKYYKRRKIREAS